MGHQHVQQVGTNETWLSVLAGWANEVKPTALALSRHTVPTAQGPSYAYVAELSGWSPLRQPKGPPTYVTASGQTAVEALARAALSWCVPVAEQCPPMLDGVRDSLRGLMIAQGLSPALAEVVDRHFHPYGGHVTSRQIELVETAMRNEGLHPTDGQSFTLPPEWRHDDPQLLWNLDHAASGDRWRRFAGDGYELICYEPQPHRETSAWIVYCQRKPIGYGDAATVAAAQVAASAAYEQHRVDLASKDDGRTTIDVATEANMETPSCRSCRDCGEAFDPRRMIDKTRCAPCYNGIPVGSPKRQWGHDMSEPTAVELTELQLAAVRAAGAAETVNHYRQENETLKVRLKDAEMEKAQVSQEAERAARQCADLQARLDAREGGKRMMRLECVKRRHLDAYTTVYEFEADGGRPCYLALAREAPGHRWTREGHAAAQERLSSLLGGNVVLRITRDGEEYDAFELVPAEPIDLARRR